MTTSVNLPFQNIFPVPEFLADSNLLAKHPETEERTVSLYLSSSNAYTPLHVDSYGFAGWAFLFQGLKRWEFIHPQHYEDFHDASLGGPRDTPASQLPPEVELWRATAGERDLVYIPPGWLHRQVLRRIRFADRVLRSSMGPAGGQLRFWVNSRRLHHSRSEATLFVNKSHPCCIGRSGFQTILGSLNNGMGNEAYLQSEPSFSFRVWTDEPSFGFGGACAMPWEVESIKHHWRQEKRLGIALDKDLDTIFNELQKRVAIE